MAHISFSPSAFADSILHLGQSKRRGKILIGIATGWQTPQKVEKKICPVKSKE